MYQFIEKIDYKAFFWFNAELIENMNWAMLSKAAKAVFPVIACHVGKDGKAFPGEQRISALCGLTEKSVRQGIKNLEGFSGFSWKHYSTRKGRSKKFFVKLHKGYGSFPFHHAILHSGNWSELTPSGKALYPVMRHFSFFDIQEYLAYEPEHMEYGPDDFDEVYRERTYDFCDVPKKTLAEYAGMDQGTINSTLESLRRCHLVEKFIDRPGWKVYLRDNGLIFKRGLSQ